MRTLRHIGTPSNLTVLAMIAFPALAACTTEDAHAQPAETAQTTSALHGEDHDEGASLLGLYSAEADLGPTLPQPMLDYLLLQPGDTAVGLTASQSFGAASSVPGQFPSNAVGSLLTWHAHGRSLELRMLRPFFVPTGAPAGYPQQVFAGYLRGLFELHRGPHHTWQGTALVEAVQVIGTGTCLNGKTGIPCVTRAYQGTISLTPMDPWDQPDQPHL